MTLANFFSLAGPANESREMDEFIAATDAGLEAADCTGVILGNDDLEESCAYIPRVIPVTPDYILPGCAHVPALATIERVKS